MTKNLFFPGILALSLFFAANSEAATLQNQVAVPAALAGLFDCRLQEAGAGAILLQNSRVDHMQLINRVGSGALSESGPNHKADSIRENDYRGVFTRLQATTVQEPTIMMLFGAGLATIAGIIGRKTKK